MSKMFFVSMDSPLYVLANSSPGAQIATFADSCRNNTIDSVCSFLSSPNARINSIIGFVNDSTCLPLNRMGTTVLSASLSRSFRKDLSWSICRMPSIDTQALVNGQSFVVVSDAVHA